MPRVWPDTAALVALREVVALGFYRGILNQLDAIEARQPDCAAFVTELRTLARQFQFETMGRILSADPPEPSLAHVPPPHLTCTRPWTAPTAMWC